MATQPNWPADPNDPDVPVNPGVTIPLQIPGASQSNDYMAIDTLEEAAIILYPHKKRWDAWQALEDADKARYLIIAYDNMALLRYNELETTAQAHEFASDIRKGGVLFASALVLRPDATGPSKAHQPNVKKRVLDTLSVEFFHPNAVGELNPTISRAIAPSNPSRLIRDVDPEAWECIAKWTRSSPASSAFNGSTFATGNSSEASWYESNWGTNREGVGLRSNVR